MNANKVLAALMLLLPVAALAILVLNPSVGGVAAQFGLDLGEDSPSVFYDCRYMGNEICGDTSHNRILGYY